MNNREKKNPKSFRKKNRVHHAIIAVGCIWQIIKRAVHCSATKFYHNQRYIQEIRTIIAIVHEHTSRALYVQQLCASTLI